MFAEAIGNSLNAWPQKIYLFGFFVELVEGMVENGCAFSVIAIANIEFVKLIYYKQINVIDIVAIDRAFLR